LVEKRRSDVFRLGIADSSLEVTGVTLVLSFDMTTGATI